MSFFFIGGGNMPRIKHPAFRVIHFYLLIGALLFFSVNYRKVAEHSWPKTLSRLRVNYACLINASDGAAPDHAALVDSKRYFNAVIQLYGPSSSADAFLGMSYFYLGDRNEARKSFLRLMGREVGFFWPQYDLAVLAYLDKDYSTASDFGQKALELPVDRSVSFMVKSKIYQPLFIENGMTPQILAQDIDRAKLLLFQMLIVIRSGQTEHFSARLPVTVF